MSEPQSNTRHNFSKRYLIFQIIIIGLLTGGAGVFGFFEGSFFNTYIEHFLKIRETLLKKSRKI